MQNANRQFVTAEYPVISVVRELVPANGPSASVSRLSHASFIGTRTRPDGLALARIEGSGLGAHALTAYAATPGFHVELFAERTRCGGSMIVGLRIMRGRSNSPECRIRFVCGASTANATILVD